MFRWKRNLVKDIKALQESYCDLEAKYKELLETVNSQEWLDTWHQYLANKESAAKQGHFYISADDTALLERFIQEVNRDPDLAILMTTAGGTTVSLRTHPHPESKYSFAHKFEGGEA